MVTVLMAVIVCSGLYAFYTFSAPPSGKQAREHAEHAGQEAGGGLGPATMSSSSQDAVFGSPYYISCEGKIIGSPVDILAIQNVTGGTLHPGYVEWNKTKTPPSPNDISIINIYRVYIDNEMQVIVHGKLREVINTIHAEGDYCGIPILKLWLVEEFDWLKNEGAIDSSSCLSIRYKSSVVRGFWKTWYWRRWDDHLEQEFTVITQESIRLLYLSGCDISWVRVSMNDSVVIESHPRGDLRPIWQTPHTDLSGVINIKIEAHETQFGIGAVWLTIYTPDNSTTSLAPGHEVYISGCPGTGIAVKRLCPPTMLPGGSVTVRTIFDPPAAEHINITDAFPTGFSLISSVILKKYANDTLIATATVQVSLEEVDGIYQFTILYTDAPDILESLEWYEWVVVEYTLEAPSSPGVYEFPAAQITYVVVGLGG